LSIEFRNGHCAVRIVEITEVRNKFPSAEIQNRLESLSDVIQQRYLRREREVKRKFERRVDCFFI
jgi:hypothetical protein